MGRLWAFSAVSVRGCGLLAPVRRCGRLCGAFPAVIVWEYPRRRCVALWRLWAALWACLYPCARLRRGSVPLWPVEDCTRGGSVHLCVAVGCGCPAGAVVEYPGRLSPVAALSIARAGRLWAILCRDREKPGQAVQAPPGHKRTAAGIAPGAALWFHLFIFSNSDRIANGIIKSTNKTNIFDFHPLKQP